MFMGRLDCASTHFAINRLVGVKLGPHLLADYLPGDRLDTSGVDLGGTPPEFGRPIRMQ